MLAQPARGAFAGPPVPKKDMVVADGQKLTLGDTTITMYLTPGHALGTISLIIPAAILTPTLVRNYMQVVDHCAQAVGLAQNAAKTK